MRVSIDTAVQPCEVKGSVRTWEMGQNAREILLRLAVACERGGGTEACVGAQREVVLPITRADG